MNEQVGLYLERFPKEVIDLFNAVRRIVLDSASMKPEERLWAKMPSYYVGTSFVRIIVFKDHVNIEAKTAVEYKDELAGYKMTPKGMLQIFVGPEIPFDVLKRIFTEILG